MISSPFNSAGNAAVVLILYFLLRVQSPVFFRSQRLQSKRLSQPRHSSSSGLLVQCVSSTFGSSSNDGVERQQNSATSNTMDKASEPIRAFPWAKAGNVLLRRLLGQLWTVGKWLVIPVLALSVLSELSYTLLQENVLIIPIGMICGIVFAGIMRETALELSPSIEVFPYQSSELNMFRIFSYTSDTCIYAM